MKFVEIGESPPGVFESMERENGGMGCSSYVDIGDLCDCRRYEHDAKGEAAKVRALRNDAFFKTLETFAKQYDRVRELIGAALGIPKGTL